MYQGISALSLDTKGRMLIPTKYRDALAVECESQLTLTRHPHGCLLLLPRSIWNVMSKEISAWPMSARAWQRIFLGYATNVDLDTAGRILIPPELRQVAQLEKDITLLGIGSHFEIWNSNHYMLQEQEAIQTGMPESIKDFSF